MRHSKITSESSSGTLYPSKIDVFFGTFPKGLCNFSKKSWSKGSFWTPSICYIIVRIKNDLSPLPSWKISKKSAILVARTIIAQLNKVFWNKKCVFTFSRHSFLHAARCKTDKIESGCARNWKYKKAFLSQYNTMGQPSTAVMGTNEILEQNYLKAKSLSARVS